MLTIAEHDNNRVTRVRIDPDALRKPVSQPCGVVRAEDLAPITVMKATRITVKRAKARVPIGCSGTVSRTCEGKVALLRSSVKRGVKTKPRDLLAKASYRVTRSGIVAVKLKRAERRILAKKRRLKVRLVVQPTRGAAISRRVTLAPARSR